VDFLDLFFNGRGEGGLDKVRGISSKSKKSGQRNRIVFAILAKKKWQKNDKKMAKILAGIATPNINKFHFS